MDQSADNIIEGIEKGANKAKMYGDSTDDVIASVHDS